MIRTATEALANSCERFSFAVADAHSIPFADRQFDAVVANHMLYHVPDRAQAFSEIHRTLRPDGRLFAATNGDSHMRQLEDLVQRFDPSLGYHLGELGFTLENGAEQLCPWFSEIEVRLHVDALCVTEAEPLVDYVFSAIEADDETRRTFVGFVRDELKSQGGAIHIGKSSGMLIAGRKCQACGT
jgi:SAM-dependent methyltransferase